MKTKDKFRIFDDGLNEDQIKELNKELDQHSKMPMGNYVVEGDHGIYDITIKYSKIVIFLKSAK